MSLSACPFVLAISYLSAKAFCFFLHLSLPDFLGKGFLWQGKDHFWSYIMKWQDKCKMQRDLRNYITKNIQMSQALTMIFSLNGTNSIPLPQRHLSYSRMRKMLHFYCFPKKGGKNCSILSSTLESEDINPCFAPWVGFILIYNSGMGSYESKLLNWDPAVQSCKNQDDNTRLSFWSPFFLNIYM